MFRWTKIVLHNFNHAVGMYLFAYVHWQTGLCFSDEELDNRDGKKEFVELDSLDTEKALLLTDDDDPLWVCLQSVFTVNHLINCQKI